MSYDPLYDPQPEVIEAITEKVAFKSAFELNLSTMSRPVAAREAFKSYMGGFWLDDSKLSIPNKNALNYISAKFAKADPKPQPVGEDLYTETIPGVAGDVIEGAFDGLLKYANFLKWVAIIGVTAYVAPKVIGAAKDARQLAKT